LGVWDVRNHGRPVGRVRRDVPGDEGDWFRRLLGFEPDDLQERVLRSRSRHGILNCTRQWGKSTITAAMAVRQAYSQAESLTLVVSPSARQSGEFLRKAEGFVRRLDQRVKGDGDNEMSLELANRSRIIGLPGSEATIRGFSAVALLLVDEASRVSDGEFLHGTGVELKLLAQPASPIAESGFRKAGLVRSRNQRRHTGVVRHYRRLLFFVPSQAEAIKHPASADVHTPIGNRRSGKAFVVQFADRQNLPIRTRLHDRDHAGIAHEENLAVSRHRRSVILVHRASQTALFERLSVCRIDGRENTAIVDHVDHSAIQQRGG